jgi:hypothetical protein
VLILGLGALEASPLYILVMLFGGLGIVGGAGVLRRRLWARPPVFVFSGISGLAALSSLVYASLYSDDLSGRAFLLAVFTSVFAYSLWCVYLFRPLRWFRPQNCMADFGFSSVIRISLFVFIICFLLILLPLIH